MLYFVEAVHEFGDGGVQANIPHEQILVQTATKERVGIEVAPSEARLHWVILEFATEIGAPRHIPQIDIAAHGRS